MSVLVFLSLFVLSNLSFYVVSFSNTRLEVQSEKNIVNKSELDVAIVGAGPSGLALAHCLIDRGYKVRVLERRSTFRPVGSAVFMHPFALNSLENLSQTVYNNVIKASTQVGRVTVKSTTNTKNQAAFEAFDKAPGVFGNPFVTITFWDLLQSLRLGLPDDIFCFGSDVQGYQECDDGNVSLQIQGSASIKAKMIIDASGIRSNIRKQLTNTQSVPFCKAYMAVLPAIKANPIMNQTNTMASRELGFLIGDVDGMTLATLQNGDVWWTYTYFDDDLDSSLQQHDLVKRVKGRYPTFVAQLLQETTDRVETVIADLPVAWKWGDGMVTLLGDSAHAQLPALGLGCSAAFADIEELIKQIDSNGLCQRALRRYERWRMPQMAVLQTASRFTFGGMRNVGTMK